MDEIDGSFIHGWIRLMDLSLMDWWIIHWWMD